MRNRLAFTLTELLVVIAIIAVLAAILTPVYLYAKRKAFEAASIQNLRQLGMAVGMYRNNHDDKLPKYLSDLYPNYVEQESLFICPLDPKSGQHPQTSRLEGNGILSSGVSYTWVPNWNRAIELGWWDPWPQRGSGKWDDATPIIENHWFWARKFNERFEEDQIKNAGGRVVIVLADGSIRFWPSKVRTTEYEPG